MKSILCLGAALLMLLSTGCGGSSKPTASSPSPSESPAASLPPNTVQGVEYSFLPRQLDVAVGTKVTWINAGAVPHRVYSLTKLFDSHPNCQPKGTAPAYLESTGCMAPQQTFSYTFTKPGRYFYTCPLHTLWEDSQPTDKMADRMSGLIVVT